MTNPERSRRPSTSPILSNYKPRARCVAVQASPSSGFPRCSRGALVRRLKLTEIERMNFPGGFEPCLAYDGFL